MLLLSCKGKLLKCTSWAGHNLIQFSIFNLVVKELRKARNVFERKLVEDVKNNPKSFYRYVRTKTKSKDREIGRAHV